MLRLSLRHSRSTPPRAGQHEFCAHKPAQQGPKRIALCPIKLDWMLIKLLSLNWPRIEVAVLMNEEVIDHSSNE